MPKNIRMLLSRRRRTQIWARRWHMHLFAGLDTGTHYGTGETYETAWQFNVYAEKVLIGFYDNEVGDPCFT